MKPSSPGDGDTLTSYVNSSAYPYSTVVRLEVTYPNGRTGTGSGVVVSQNDVLTAGHMVWQAEFGGAATHVRIVPAQNGSIEPYGHYDGARWDYFETDQDGDGLLSQFDAANDVAVVSTREPISMTTGTMGIDPNFVSGALSATGYPGAYGFYYMTTDSDFVAARGDGTLNTSLIELNPGNSGGPLWYMSGSTPYVAGIVSTGASGFDIGGAHYGTILSWMEDNNDLVAAGTAGNDTLAGSSRADTIRMGLGNDRYDGGGDSDLIYGNQGMDSLAGGAGNDTIYGGQNGGPAGTDGVLRQGADTIDGGDGADAIYGNHGPDLLSGGAGNDALHGGQDADTLYGGAGDDTLAGNRDGDLMFGGAGADRFLVAGNDTIGDFSAAEGDRVRVAAGTGFTQAAEADGVLVTLGTGTTVKLIGVAAIGVSEFEFV